MIGGYCDNVKGDDSRDRSGLDWQVAVWLGSLASSPRYVRTTDERTGTEVAAGALAKAEIGSDWARR